MDDVSSILPPAQALGEIPREQRNNLLLMALEAGAFDFLDFGTHKGGGLESGRRFGGRLGLGVEIEELKCQHLYRQGHYVLSGDVFNLPVLPRSVDFTVCSHVLEHMPNKHVMYLLVERLAQFCRKFIVIDQPDFSAAQYLYDLGLKMTQMMMESHTTRLATRDIIQMLWDMGLGNFVVYGKLPVRSSDSRWVHSAVAPRHANKWQEGDPPKPSVKFDRELHRDILIVVGLHDEIDLEAIAATAGAHKLKLRSYSSMF